MAMARYEPWSLMNQLHSEMNRLFEGYRPDMDESSVATSSWVPAVDIREEQNQYVLEADIPGVDPKDIDISMEGGVLSFRGERRFEHEDNRNGVRRVERAHGTFYRRFTLPEDADPDGISAKGNQGVLQVTIPKSERAQPRKITVEG